MQIKAYLNSGKIRAALRGGCQKESPAASRCGLVRRTRVASNGVDARGLMASPSFGRAMCSAMAANLAESRNAEGRALAPIAQKAFSGLIMGQKGARARGASRGGLI